MKRLRILGSYVLLASCVGNFDASLYQAREADAGTPGIDASIPTLALIDSCLNMDAVTVLPRPASAMDAESTAYHIDTTSLTNDISDVVACTGHTENGNDGFVALMILDNERWHFHLRNPTNSANTALYIMDTCDGRACQSNGGEDLCGPSADEHFSFAPAHGGMFYLGVDSDDPGGFAGELDVIYPVCGNHTREHSEGCDDGNTVSGDGCDSVCRVELANLASESEANDDTYSANHVILGATSGTTTINAHLAAACESDVFAFDVPSGEAAAITVSFALTAGGCPTDALVPVVLDVLLPDGSTVLATITIASSGGCLMLGGAANPSLAALAPGTYYARVRAVSNTAPDRPMDYSLAITATFTP